MDKISRLLGLSASLLVAGCSGTINEYLVLAQRGDVDEVREAVLMIGSLLVQKEQEGYAFDDGDAEAVKYLQAVARDHSDQICRMRAVSALRRLLEVDSSDIFIAAVQDDRWGVRLEAAKALAERPSPEASPILAERLKSEARDEVRIDIIKALANVGDRRALRALLEIILFDPGGKYQGNRLRAYDAIRAISGKTFPLEDTEAWRDYYRSEFPESPDEGSG